MNTQRNTNAFKKNADVAKAASGSCILNSAVHPCSSGNDLPGDGKIEIDTRDRQAQHLHTVGGCKKTPASSSEASQRRAAAI